MVSRAGMKEGIVNDRKLFFFPFCACELVCRRRRKGYAPAQQQQLPAFRERVCAITATPRVTASRMREGFCCCILALSITESLGVYIGLAFWFRLQGKWVDDDSFHNLYLGRSWICLGNDFQDGLFPHWEYESIDENLGERYIEYSSLSTSRSFYIERFQAIMIIINW